MAEGEAKVENMRQAFKAAYRIFMILVTAALVIGAGAAFWHGDEANGLWLVGGIAAILALISGLSIDKLDRQDEQAETYAEIGREIREKLPFSLHFSSDGNIRMGIDERSVPVQFAEPEVHRVDNSMLEEAKRMASAGAPIDDICRLVDPQHDGHDAFHQEAFRKMVRSMVDQD
jgi:hypothetical protein